MKVMQITSEAGSGSIARTTAELSKMLVEKGHTSYVVHCDECDSCVGISYKMGNKISRKIHAVFSKVFGLQGYFSVFSTLKLLSYINKIEPDIINIRNLHSNFININMLLGFIAKKNIATVVTLHDCYFYTGRCCHYTDTGCDKWQTLCHNCPRLKEDNPSLFFDFSKKMYADKKRAFSKIKNLAVVGVSDWITNEAKKSFLKDAKIVKRIYNWVSTDTFRNINLSSKKADDKFVILGVSSIWKRTKGLYDFIKLAEILPENFEIILIGKLRKGVSISNKIKLISEIEDLDTLTKYYNLADVFLNLSYEETFGKVTAEALACGTPSIVYNTTACSELIGEKCGAVVALSNIDMLYEKILEIKANGKEYYSENCINFVRANFDYNKNANEYIELYKNLLGENHAD